MARIELRDATIRIKDGFGGAGLVNDSSISGSDTSLGVDTLTGLPNSTTVVPVGARFTIDTVASTVFTVTAKNDNQKYTLTITGGSGGTFDLTLDSQSVAAIAYNADAGTIQTAINGVLGASSVTVTGAGPFVIEFSGSAYAGTAVTGTIDDANITGGGSGTLVELSPGAVTNELTFTPALDGGDLPSNNDVITFLPQQIAVKIGNGNLTYTETKNYEYELDRGNLDSVREGDEAPMEISLEFVYEFVRTGTSEAITPVDALKGIGGAAGWFSSSSDQCEPYAVDLEVEHNPPCGTAETETTIFPDFRRDSLEFDLSAATIAVSGKCNASEPTITRS